MIDAWYADDSQALVWPEAVESFLVAMDAAAGHEKTMRMILKIDLMTILKIDLKMMLICSISSDVLVVVFRF